MTSRTKRPGGKTAKPDRTRKDWLLAALAALADGGIAAVKVERLAASLRVSKGSFYWHFKDRAELLSALLDLWDSDFTQELIDGAAHLRTAEARLRHVAREALQQTMATGIDSARAEAALQAWAATDPQAAERLRAVDEARAGYISRELIEAGMPARKAKVMAKAIYLALLGLYAARAYNPRLADDEALLALTKLVLSSAAKG